MEVITWSCPNLSETMLVKGTTDVVHHIETCIRILNQPWYVLFENSCDMHDIRWGRTSKS